MAPTDPAMWRDLLEKRLHDRWNAWKVFNDYYEGDQRVSRWLRSVRAAFSGTVLGNLLDSVNDNYMALVVDSAAERCRVQGFRFGNDTDGDAWRIWTANGLKSESNMLHTEAIKLGEAYWMVQPTDGLPLITSEHPSQVIVARAPGNRRMRLAALKKWSDGDLVYANLYLPDRVAKYRSDDRRLREHMPDKRWESLGVEPNPLGEVPVVPVQNNPSMLGGGRSDLAGGVVALQDQILKTVADSLIGGEYQGLPQRVLLGVEPPRDPNTGKPIPFEQAAKSRLWYFSNADAKAHEFSQADLKALRDTVDGFIGDLAAQTRIPIYYFRPQAISNLSAEALVGLDAGLVSKTDDKKDPFGQGHLEAMRLAFKAQDANDPRATTLDAEVLWKNTESRSVAQLTDAVVKEVQAGLISREAALEKLGYSPEAIDRILAQSAEESFLTVPNGSEPAVTPAN